MRCKSFLSVKAVILHTPHMFEESATYYFAMGLIFFRELFINYCGEWDGSVSVSQTRHSHWIPLLKVPHDGLNIFPENFLRTEESVSPFMAIRDHIIRGDIRHAGMANSFSLVVVAIRTYEKMSNTERGTYVSFSPWVCLVIEACVLYY